MSVPAPFPFKYPVVIAGGGIGGLALAVGLSRAGIPCRVYERAAEFRAAGAGLSLWANATAALKQLGLLSAAQAYGSELRALQLPDEQGRILSHLPLATHGTPALGLERTHLQHVLAATLPAGFVQTGCEVTGFESQEDRVLVHLSDGTKVEASLLIGADGLRSSVRENLHGVSSPRYGGCLCWRGLVTIALHRPLGLFTESWGRGRRFGLMPCGPDKYYWYATLNHPPGVAATLGGDRDRVQREFSGWHDPIGVVIAATPPDAMMCHDLEDRPPQAPWGAGRVTLLGDAAHAMLPNLGQGGGTALEDAVTLAQLLSRGCFSLAALRAWESSRHQRTCAIQNQARRIGQIGQLAHPWAVALRNTALRLTPTRVNAASTLRLHGWTPPR